jgi:hypothetical protein
MKTRESGMPEESLWQSFFHPADTLRELGMRPDMGAVVEFGCGTGTFTIPAAELVAGADNVIDEVDLAHGLNGFVTGDDIVWQSTTIEAGVSGTDEWGFSSQMFPYDDPAWTANGFMYLRVFQDESPQLGEAFFDTPLLAIYNTADSVGGIFGQIFSVDSSNAGITLNQRMLQTTQIVRTTGPNELDLMSVPLYVDPTNQFGIIASNAAVGSTVYFYDPAFSNFSAGAKSSKGWASAQANRVVLPGESFFLKADVSSGHEITITGAVPIAPITNQVHDRWSALGYPFPVPVTWTDTSLSSNLPAGTLAYFWNQTNQEYNILLKGPPAKGGWGAEGSSTILQPGDGFFVRQPLGSSAFEWVVQP